MATCSPSELMLAGKCFCPVTATPYKKMKLALLCNIATSLGMNCNVATLMADAACFCAVTNDPYEKVELQLLCEIAAGVGGGGGGGGMGQIVLYTGTDPNTDGVFPANLNAPAIAVKPGETTFTWTEPAGPWA